jgi:ribonuclease-3
VSQSRADLAEVEQRIGYNFQDRALLREALTHGSSQQAHYQRLEFLGDRVLGLAVADMLFAHFPGAPEGELSRRLSELVRRETCAEVAIAWNLGPYLTFGAGEKSRIRANRSILGDACEAVIGAVFRDGGFAPAQDVVQRAFSNRLDTAALPRSNPKAALQEWAAGRGLPTPCYDVAERTGPDHEPEFRIVVRVQGLTEASGTGPAKRAAEQDAARSLLLREGIWEAG